MTTNRDKPKSLQIPLGVVLASLSIVVFASTGAARELSESRTELEGKIETLASAYHAAPGDVAARPG